MLSQFLALSWKNWILFKRNWLFSAIEIVFPVVFAVLLYVARTEFPSTYFESLGYVDTEPYYSAPYPTTNQSLQLMKEKGVLPLK